MPEDTPEYLKRKECADCLVRVLENLTDDSVKNYNSLIVTQANMILNLRNELENLHKRHAALLAQSAEPTAGGRIDG